MLVLSRKVSERIWIGDQICVTIVRINGNAVRIGIDAPPYLSVVRDELKQRQQPSSSAGEAVQLVREPQPLVREPQPLVREPQPLVREPQPQ